MFGLWHLPNQFCLPDATKSLSMSQRSAPQPATTGLWVWTRRRHQAFGLSRTISQFRVSYSSIKGRGKLSMATESHNHRMLEQGGTLESSSLLEPWDGEDFAPDLPVSHHLKVHICQQWHSQNTRNQGFNNTMKEQPNSGKPYIWPKGFAGSKNPQPSSESFNLRHVKKARGVFSILANRVATQYQME